MKRKKEDGIWDMERTKVKIGDKIKVSRRKEGGSLKAEKKD